MVLNFNFIINFKSMSRRFYFRYKSAVLGVIFFFVTWTAEAACFSRQQLYRMQTSSLEEIQTNLKAEGWVLAAPSSVDEGTTGFGFKKSVFTKNGNERVDVYTSSTDGNLIHLKVGDACFQTISGTEFGQLSRKLMIDQNKVISEYRAANHIIQLVEHAGSDATNPEILIFNEALKSQVKVLSQSNPEVSPKAATSSSNSSGTAGKEAVYDEVETLPIPSGGMAGWSSYLSTNLGYPTTARRKGIEGTVIVAFVVNTDGTVSDFELLRGIGGGCDEEAIRIVKNSPKWTPGMQSGKAVRTRMRFPLKFELGEPDPTGDSTNVAFHAVILPSAAFMK
jgi:TonB family protein